MDGLTMGRRRLLKLVTLTALIAPAGALAACAGGADRPRRSLGGGNRGGEKSGGNGNGPGGRG